MKDKVTSCVAMLLAGGEGKRLGNLTSHLAKPAVEFGGKYRLIDFPLSNCSHSGIEVVGVLTQYEPFLLHSYIGSGGEWDLEREYGGITLLPPYAEKSGMKWYKGTANAVYENISFVDHYNPEYVLILSADHVYTMDYSKMLQFHQLKNADATISVIEVPWHEANRFGIMNTREDHSIYEFEEKPAYPKSNLASMGIYIFNWSILKKFLIEDANQKESSHDFGKDIIPQFLLHQMNLFAYPFQGYWKDVGTLHSLWESNMDLLEENFSLNLHDKNWRIYSSNTHLAPQFLSKTAKIKQSIVNEGCSIHGHVDHSVLFANVYIGEGSNLKDCVVMSGAKIGSNCNLERVIIANDVHIPDGSCIGSNDPDGEVVLIGSSKTKVS